MAIEAAQPGSLPQQLLQGRISRSRPAKLLAFLFFLFVALPHQSRSQQKDLVFEDVPLSEGVQPSIRYIFQDRVGHLWFVTWSGLYKHDGYTFTPYQHDVDDTTSLFDNTLSTVYEDRDGILWIGSRFGLERFDPESETFTHFVPNPKDTIGNKSNEVWAVCEDNFGTLWIGTSYGLYKFDRTNNNFTCLRHDSTDSGSIASNSVQLIYEDKQGNIWFGTKAGLDKYDLKTGRFTHYYHDPDAGENSPLMYRANYMLEDEEGILWLGTDRGLVEFNTKDGTLFSHLFNPTNPINRIISIFHDDRTDCLWLATADGLFSFDKRSKTFTRYSSAAGNFLLCERSGTMWLGTHTGIKKLNRVQQPFKKYPMPKPVLVITNGKEGEIWFMYAGKLWNKFDISEEKIVPYSFGSYRLKLVTFLRAEKYLRTENGGLFIQDTLGRTIFSLDSSWKDYVSLTSMFCETDGGVYIGGWDGHFDFWDLKTNQVIKIRKFQQAPYYLYKDSLGFVWIATFMGELYLYNPSNGTFKEYIIDTRNPANLSGNRIVQIYEDKKGRLWFATNGGLNRLDRSTDSFTHFTVKNGLPSDNIRGILEDDHGNLWLNTSKGISKFDPETGKCKNYDVSYGLDTPTDYYYGMGCRTRNDEMFFACAGGITRFHPDSVKDNPFIPPVVVTTFKKFDNPSPFSSEIRLPYDENFLSFEFAALSYISPERNQYAYMMEGLDKDWVYCGTRRFASYPGLDPGEYVFRVKGSNNDGVWNEAGTSISLVISPPWWRAKWAYILYAALLLGIVYFTWTMQVKRIRIAHQFEMSRFEAEKLHEVDAMKSRFFANISHEFRTPLTLILGPVKQIIGVTEDPKIRNDLRVVHRNASRLLGLVNQLLDISKLESGTMKLQTESQNIVPLLKGLVLSFASYAERKKIALTFSSTEDTISAYIDRDKVEKIITNILANAFKFTPEGGRIEVAITRDQACADVTVRDTGIGIPEERIGKIFDRFYQVDGSHTREHEGTGIGLSLTKELVELHKGTIEVESTEGKGTTFTVRIRLGRDHLKPEEICEPEAKEQEVGRAGKEAALVEEEVTSNEETSRQGAEIGLLAEAGKPLLLIVEDNADVRNYIRNNVAQKYRILEAIDGQDGWTKSIEHLPDIIVSDVMMPKMDGFRLCEKLKTNERTSHIPLILLTAKACTQDKIEGYHTGADDYIMKPFEPEELNARIKNLIAQRKRIHEYFRSHGLLEIESKNITPVDQKLLQRAAEIISRHMSDAAFGVESLAAEMAVSRSVLFKKIEALVGEPPSELIKRSRLNRAAELIERKFGNISEIALEVGFNNPSYFAECFKRQFGCTPSQYHRTPTVH